MPRRGGHGEAEEHCTLIGGQFQGMLMRWTRNWRALGCVRMPEDLDRSGAVGVQQCEQHPVSCNTHRGKTSVPM